MKPLLPAPKSRRPPREPFDADEWRRKGAATYAERRDEEIRRRVEADPGYRLLEPGGPLPETNPARLKKLREEQYAVASGYHKWVMDQPCAACGSQDPDVKSDPAHVGKTKGAGGKAERTLSLCRLCHDWEHNDTPAFEEAFQDRHGVTPEEMALYRYEMFHRDQK